MFATLADMTFWTEVQRGAEDSIVCAGETRSVPAGAAIRVLASVDGRALVSTEIQERNERRHGRTVVCSDRRTVYAWGAIGSDVPDPAAPRKCLRCKGARSVTYGAIAGVQAQTYACDSCDTNGEFTAPDVNAIVAAITSTRGPSKGRIKSSPPKGNDRAYYVWRWARFHGGVDTTLPMMAGVLNHSDPFLPELEALAEVVAKRAFGSDTRGVARWSRALIG